jgi:hypothetical protein
MPACCRPQKTAVAVAYAKPGKGLLKLNGETRISKHRGKGQTEQQQHNGVWGRPPAHAGSGGQHVGRRLLFGVGSTTRPAGRLAGHSSSAAEAGAADLCCATAVGVHVAAAAVCRGVSQWPGLHQTLGAAAGSSVGRQAGALAGTQLRVERPCLHRVSADSSSSVWSRAATPLGAAAAAAWA